MATKSNVRKLESKVKVKFSVMEMRMSLLKSNPCEETVDRYYIASDDLDDALDDYYAASIMYFSIEKKELYNLYIAQSKEEVKRKFLRKITNYKKARLSCQIIDKRLQDLEEEKVILIRKKKKGERYKRINFEISRLRRWMEN